MRLAISNNPRVQDIILDEVEFIAALRYITTQEHYPRLCIHADDLRNPKHTGGMIYEGVRVDTRVLDFDKEKPEMRIQLTSPEQLTLNTKDIRNFDKLGGVRYWNGAHPLLESHHGIRTPAHRGLNLTDGPAWVIKAVAELRKDAPQFFRNEPAEIS